MRIALCILQGTINLSPMKTIIAALDFSDSSALVLDAAIAQAKLQQAKLLLVHVIEPLPSYTAYGMTPDEYPMIQQFQDNSQKYAETQLRSAAGLAGTLVSEVHSLCTVGMALPTLCEQVEEHQASLIVLGTHGHGVLGSLLLGSVAEGMVRRALCPTLIIPCKKND